MSTSRPAHLFEQLSEGASTITEGSTSIKFPKGEVFYNPVQQFNRDLSITVIQSFAEKYLSEKRSRESSGLVIFEALSATGLRSIRYAKEIRGVSKIITNDLDPAAVDLIRENVALNAKDNPGIERIILPNQGDANNALHKFKDQGIIPDVIDLDPYGSAAPFIDSAVQCIADGGLLCVTCTDLAVLCATRQETCFAKYGGLPVRGDVCHEAALRLVLQSLEVSANRYRRHIVPLLSCSIDFYVRIFVRVFESPANVKLSSTKRGLVGRCVQCRTLSHKPFLCLEGEAPKQKFVTNSIISDRCDVCTSRVELCGPMWLSSVHDKEFALGVLKSLNPVSEFIGTGSRIEGFVSELDVPFFFSLPEMASFMKLSVPPLLDFRSAILNAGFLVSGSHTEPNAIKSNAPARILWKILIEWARKIGNTKQWAEDNPAGQLFQKIEKIECEPINFTRHPNCNPTSRGQGLKRFQENPTKNWGPLARARKSKISQD